MDPVQFKLTADAAPILASLDNVADAMKGIQTEYQKTQKAGKTLFAPSTEGAIKQVDEIEKLQTEYAQLEKAAKTLKGALASATDPRAIAKYTTDIAKAEAGLAKLRDVAKATGVSVKGVNKELSTSKEVFEGLVGSITKATIILAVVQAVVQFTKELVTFSASIQKSEKQFENFTGSAEKAKETVAGLVELSNKKFLNTQEVLDSGKALLAFGISGDELESTLSRIADVSAATGKNFQELAVIYGKARAAGVLYAEDINQLVDAGIPIIAEFANQLGVSESQVKKLASEGKISFEELQLAFFNLSEEGGKFAGQAEAQAATLGGAWRKLSSTILTALRPIGDAITDQITKRLQQATFTLELIGNLFSGDSIKNALEGARETTFGIESSKTRIKKEVDDFQTELLTGEKKQQQNILAISQERLKLEKAALDKRADLEKDANAKLAEQRRKEAEKLAQEEARNQQQRAQLRAELTADETEKQIALEQLKYDSLTGELKKYFKAGDELNGLLLKAQTDFEDNVSKIRSKALLEQLEFQLEAEKVRKKDLQNIANATTEQVEAVRKEAAENAKVRRDVALGNIAIAKEEGQGLILELKRQGANEDKVKKAQLVLDAEIRLASLQAELQYQKDLLAIVDDTDTERVAAINRQIELLGKQISNAAAGLEIDTAPGKGFLSKFIESLGLSPDDVSVLQDAAAKIVGAISDITAARVNDADVALQVAEDRVAAAEDALTREIELGEAGFASNVGNAQLALESAKKAEAEALEVKKKAAKAQLGIDSALQASAIATSAAQLVKTWATLPFGVGLIAAAAQVAGLFAFLAGVRTKAKAIAQFGEGGEAGVDGNSIVTGPSHAGGGVGINVEGGEFMTSDGKRISIVKKTMTKKHFAILKAVNNDNVPEIGRLAAELVQSRAGSARLDTTAGQRVGASVAAGATQRQEAGSLALREQNALLRENNRLLGKIYGKNDGAVKVGNTTVITKGNQTTILRG